MSVHVVFIKLFQPRHRHHAALVEQRAGALVLVVTVCIVGYRQVDGVEAVGVKSRANERNDACINCRVQPRLFNVGFILGLGQQQGMVGAVLGVAQRVGGDGLEQRGGAVGRHGDERVQLHQARQVSLLLPTPGQQQSANAYQEQQLLHKQIHVFRLQI